MQTAFIDTNKRSIRFLRPVCNCLTGTVTTRRVEQVKTGGAVLIFLLLLFVVSGLLGGCSSPPPVTQMIDRQSVSPQLPPRPEHFDMGLPHPVSFPVRLATRQPTPEINTYVPIVLTIDTVGAVTDILPLHAGDSAYAHMYDDQLMAVEFMPGLINGEKSVFRLAARLRLLPGTRRPHIEFPVDGRRQVCNTDLYLQSFELNGIVHATIKRFPAYFSDVEVHDSLYLAPFVLAALDLDSAGRPVCIEPVLSTLPFRTSEILSAINWGVYSPAIHHGRPVASQNLLAVFLYPEVNYPTKTIDSDNPDTVNVFHRTRVKLLPAQIEQLSPAVPRNAVNGLITVGAYSSSYHTTASAVISVDTLGKARLLKTDRSARKFNDDCRLIIEQLRFYPAMDFQGCPQRFKGLVYLEFSGSKTIRIRYEWLSPHDFTAAR